jgi:exodeoxyribonuclease III
VAILTKGARPVEIRRGLPGDELDRQARYLEADLHGLRIASVYLPNGNPQPGPKFDYKLAWFERFNTRARALMESGRSVVLAGDLNVVPTRADIYNEWLWREDAVVQPETRAAFRRLLEQGWIDATRHCHPDERIYTFWVNDGAFRRNAGFRMDFLLLTPDLAPRLVDTGVDSAERGKEKPSDHAPVWVRLSSCERDGGSRAGSAAAPAATA